MCFPHPVIPHWGAKVGSFNWNARLAVLNLLGIVLIEAYTNEIFHLDG